MQGARRRSMLHLQLGQEIIYLIMAIAIFAAFYMAIQLTRDRRPEKDPPIILMREADGYSFPTGSALLSPEFGRKLNEEVVPKVQETGTAYRATVIEVIGHTDEVPLKLGRRLEADLDKTLLPLLLTGKGEPVAADNAGLGMARAVAVAHLLRKSPLGSRFQIIPMSAGPFQRPDDTAAVGGAAVADEARRRIEIRVRRQTVR